jgi:hypothetical protein
MSSKQIYILLKYDVLTKQEGTYLGPPEVHSAYTSEFMADKALQANNAGDVCFEIVETELLSMVLGENR